MTHKKRNRMYNSGNGIIKREIHHKMSFEKAAETHKIPNDREVSGIFF